MSPAVTSFKVWAITVFLNAFLFGLVELLNGEIWVAMCSVVVLTMGYVFGLPFWLLLWLLTNLIRALPYSVLGRISWLVCILGSLVALFYATIVWIITDHFTLLQPPAALLTGTTIAALILTLYFNRRAFDQGQDSHSIAKPK